MDPRLGKVPGDSKADEAEAVGGEVSVADHVRPKCGGDRSQGYPQASPLRALADVSPI
jgi:hypothetical protein